MKTRFCPSPTGYIHLGNIRTALFCYLLAKKRDGTFLLRIEDTDAERSEQKYSDALQEDLKWLGLEWDEGPFYQSERNELYQDYYKTLEKNGDAYVCFCSETQLKIARKAQLSAGKPPRYPGTCRNLSKKDIESKLAEGLKPTLRFRMPDDVVIEFNDLVRGPQKFQSNDIGDFIIRRTNGTSPFMFCNAIDDSMMGVTHVMRGEDHITNTPRQLMILRALKLREPEYGHISLIVAPDGSPLSKRHGSMSASELRDKGYLPEAVNNYLARLGHTYEHDHFMSMNQLARKFSTDSLGKAPARFDANQLLYWQKEAVAHLAPKHIWDWLSKDNQTRVGDNLRERFVEIIKPNVTFPADANAWVDSFFADELNYSDDARSVIDEAGNEYFKTALDGLNQHGADIKQITVLLKTKLGVKGKALFMPLRAALTGMLHGPELVDIVELMGVNRMRRRMSLLVK